MDTRPVLFLDSGLGGIPYCLNFRQHNPGESLIYLADREHFPYGKKQGEELKAILIKLINTLLQTIEPKIIVLACNSATVSALDELRAVFPAIPFVGTVPAVKPAVLASKTKKVGVLGTERTITDHCITDLAAQAGPCEICGIAAGDLVEFVETRIDVASPAEKREIALPYINRLRALNVDTLVLGCTHFLYLLDEFHALASPDIAVFDSLEGIRHRIESLLDDENQKLRSVLDVGLFKPGENVLLLSGTSAPEPCWQKKAEQMGFRLALLEKQ